MRDIVFLSAMLPLLFFAIRRPFIAVSLWLWSGLFVPRYWIYGLADVVSFNTLFAVLTGLSFIFGQNKPKYRLDFLLVLVLIFFFHTTVTSFFTVTIPVVVWMSWEHFAKGILLFFFISLLFRKEHQFNFFIWAIILSLGAIGLFEGAKFVLSLGRHQVHGPMGHILFDNNHFAAALCMVIPLIVYLLHGTKEKLIKLGLIGLLLACALAVLGTHSRGGLIGFIVVGGYFWLKSRHKMLSFTAFIIVAITASFFLPKSWFERMDTIETATADSSFMIRVNSWKLHTLMALDRPLLGGGFKALEDSLVWGDQAHEIDKLSFIPSPPPTERGWAAHSIYFQVLGDHGFVGLFLFLSILLTVFLKLTAIEWYYRKIDKDAWQYRLSKMLKLSLVAYCVTGGALSLAYIELAYALFAATICLTATMKEDMEAAKAKRLAERNENQPGYSGA